jgi:hypothetical protein
MSLWRGQLLIVAGLVAAFAVPYLAAATFAGYRQRQWTQSGLSAYEIDEWRDNGFDDASDAIRWRNARFKAPGALLWTQEGWDDAEEAARWKEADFGSREAKRWRAQGFAAWEAQPWRDAGFLAEDGRRWKDAGVSASEAAVRRKRGDDPR